jgi:hypothetical protein
MTASRIDWERTLAPVDEFAVFVLFGVIVAGGSPSPSAGDIRARAPSRWTGSSHARPEVEATLALEDIDQMLEAQNAPPTRRRPARAGRGGRTALGSGVRAVARGAAPPSRIAANRLVARVLTVGCGCRGRALAERLAGSGHAVRATTRNLARTAAIEAAGAEAVVADPSRLATLLPRGAARARRFPEKFRGGGATLGAARPWSCSPMRREW